MMQSLTETLASKIIQPTIKSCFRGYMIERKHNGQKQRYEATNDRGDTPHVYWYDSVGPGCCSWQRFKSICDVND